MNKEKILHHIRAAKLWLDKAEEFVKNNQLTKGLLNLLLANAEIRMPLKESFKKEEKIPQRESFFIKRLPAFTIAASIVILIFVSAYVIGVQYQLAKREVREKKEIVKKEEVIKREPIIVKEAGKEEPLKEMETMVPQVAKVEVEKEVIKEPKRVIKESPIAKKEIKIIKKKKSRYPYDEREIVKRIPPIEVVEKKEIEKKEIREEEVVEKKKEEVVTDEKIYDLMKYAEDVLKGKEEKR